MESKGKNTLRAMKVDLHFLYHHFVQYLDLNKDLSNIYHSQQSEAALTNFQSTAPTQNEPAWMLL